MDLFRPKPHTSTKLGDGLARGFEFAATTAIFLLLGWLLDRALGTQPVFMILLTVFALIGLGVKAWFTYDLAMRGHDEDRAEQQRQLAERPGGAPS